MRSSSSGLWYQRTSMVAAVPLASGIWRSKSALSSGTRPVMATRLTSTENARDHAQPDTSALGAPKSSYVCESCVTAVGLGTKFEMRRTGVHTGTSIVPVLTSMPYSKDLPRLAPAGSVGESDMVMPPGYRG